MAIDTRNKRASVIGYKAEFNEVFPNPDGTIDAADRSQLASEYPGFAAGPAPEEPTSAPYKPIWLTRRR